jgi:spore germination protein GerM
MTPRLANLLTAVGLAGLLAAVALSAPRWAALLRAPDATPEAEETAADEPVPPEAESGQTGASRRIRVRLYFEAAEREGLVSEEREVAFSSDLAHQVRTVVEEMAKGSTTGLVATLPAGTRVLEVFVQAQGVAFVDLSAEAASGLPGGSRAELLTVYSVVNTIVTNFPAVRRVRLLVDDQPVASLGGHVDVSRPLPPDMTLLALPSPSPLPSPAEPAASPTPAR